MVKGRWPYNRVAYLGGVFYIYRPQRSCGQGYVFTRVCDSVQRGGLRAGRTPRSRPLEQTPPLGADHPEQTRPRADTPLGPDLPQDQTPPRTRPPPREAHSNIRSTSGRYESYCNAFLLELLFWYHDLQWNKLSYRQQRPLVALLLLSSPPPYRLPEILYACVVRTLRVVPPPLGDLAALPRHAQWTRF